MGFFDYHVFCCTNRRGDCEKRGCCASKGAEELRDYMKARAKALKLRKTRINQAGCLDRCELGPCIVIYPENIWYSAKTIADIDEILESHLQQGKIVERLLLPG